MKYMTNMRILFRILVVLLTVFLCIAGYQIFGIGTLVRIVFLGTTIFFGWKVFWSRSAFIGAGVALMAMLISVICSPAFQDAIGPNTVWATRSARYGFPVPLLLFAFTLTVPALIAGGAIAKFAKSRGSAITGYLGIIFGCWWNIHLSFLLASITRGQITGQGGLVDVERLSGFFISRFLINTEYFLLIHGGQIVGWVVSFLPLLCSVIVVWLANSVLKRERFTNSS
ncbi:MAG: hypothetical protein ACUZ8I_06770 [Candidatus Scalindua sp.]